MTTNPLRYCFDLDNTLCETIGRNYADAVPYPKVIDEVNRLYDEGHYIIIYTARGGTSKIDHHELTVSQLAKWNVKYSELIDKNKPSFDLLIDDKAINAQTWREQNNIDITIQSKPTFLQYLNRYFAETVQIVSKMNSQDIANFTQQLKRCKSRNGRLFIVAVGGSAANASHAVNDFRKICGIETYCVSENVAELTARINDVGWNTCYSEWLKTSRLTPNDLLLVLSVGGGSNTTSQNLVEAMKYAQSTKTSIISIVSRDGGFAKDASDVCVLIPVVETTRITPHAEEWQGIILHLVVSYLSSYEN